MNTFEEELIKRFPQLERFTIDGINNFRDFVDIINIKDGRYIYKQKVREAIDKVFDSTDEEGKVHNEIIKKELGLED